MSGQDNHLLYFVKWLLEITLNNEQGRAGTHALINKQRWEAHTVFLKRLFPSYASPSPPALLNTSSQLICFWVLLGCTQYWNIFMSVHDTQGTLDLSGNYSPQNSINSEFVPWSCSNRSTRVAIEFQTTGNNFPFYLVPCYVVASSPSHTHAYHDMFLLSRLWHRIEKLCFHPFATETFQIWVALWERTANVSQHCRKVAWMITSSP